VAGPGLDQRAVHREVFIRQIGLGHLQHALEEALGDLLVEQALPILAEDGMVPDGLIPRHAHEPAEEQVVVQRLHQPPLAAHRVENLQQQHPQQALGRDRWPPHLGVEPRKLRRHLLQDLIDQLADRPQRMISRYPLLRRHITEYRILLFILSAHRDSLQLRFRTTIDAWIIVKVTKNVSFSTNC